MPARKPIAPMMMRRVKMFFHMGSFWSHVSRGKVVFMISHAA